MQADELTCGHEYVLSGVAYGCERGPHPVDGYGPAFRHAAEIDAEFAEGTDEGDGRGPDPGHRVLGPMCRLGWSRSPRRCPRRCPSPAPFGAGDTFVKDTPTLALLNSFGRAAPTPGVTRGLWLK
jgi:hypothetical protein